MDTKKFLNADEVAAEFGLDEASLKQFVESGDLRALADRGTWKYRRDELEALVDAGKIEPRSLSGSGEVLTFHNPDQPDDDVSYIELDEEALAEHATTIVKSSPAAPAPAGDDWFVPSDADEMTTPRDQSSSDVAIYSGPETGSVPSDDVPAIAADSDSDVRIASDMEVPKPEDSGILLDFNLDAGATVSSSGSSLRLPQTVPGAIENAGATETQDSAWDETPDASEASESSGVGITGEESGILLGDDSTVGGSAVRLGGDSAIASSRQDESGILLDDDSHLGFTGGSSVLAGTAGAPADDSGIAIEEDSGITLEGNRGAESVEDDDSGISLSSGDSGISLIADVAGDSGISLTAPDSGLSLEGADSGISLDSADDSGIAIDGNSRTLADVDLGMDDSGDRTQTLDLSNQDDDDSSFEINLDDGDATAELLLGDDDDADESTATVIRKGRPQPGSLSAAFELDDAAEVEDLEISEDLDAGVDEEIEELSDDEEVFDASEETFSADEVETAEDEDYLEPEEKAKKPTGPREPSWGAAMAVGLVACTLFLVANTLILWAGVSTMWDGSDAQGPAASLIQTLGDLIK
jgi:hypothetical protein